MAFKDLLKTKYISKDVLLPFYGETLLSVLKSLLFLLYSLITKSVFFSTYVIPGILLFVLIQATPIAERFRPMATDIVTN